MHSASLLQRRARELPREEFIAQFDLAFLVYGMKAAGRDRGADFKTGLFPPVRRLAGATQRVPTLVAAKRLQPQPEEEAAAGILPIVKSDRNPYMDRISVGRAASCDLVLPMTDVSKLHAHFLHGEGDVWEIRDASSTNGTWVNGVRAEPGKRIPLGPGTALRFADCPARFLDAAGLYDFLNER